MTRRDVHPVTAHRWPDLVELFGDRGAYGGCWCMWWRLSGREFSAAGPHGRREQMEDLVRSGRTPGLLAYEDGAPVGWAALAPRAEYPRVNRSPHLRPVDEVPVWAVTCFFVDRAHRGDGVAKDLLAAACDVAAAEGAPAIEGYPVDPDLRERTADEAYTGTVGMFRQAGFRELARRAPAGRAVMRRDLR